MGSRRRPKKIVLKCQRIDDLARIVCFGCGSTLNRYKIPEFQTDRATHRCPNCGARYRLDRKCLNYIRTVELKPHRSIYELGERKDG